MSIFRFGLWFSTIFGELLLEKRMPHSHWHILLVITILIVTFPGIFRKDKTQDSGQLLWFAFCLCLVPVYYLRTYDWAPIVTGALLAGFFWAYLKSTRRY